MSKIIEELEQAQMQKDVPEFGPGDTVVEVMRTIHRGQGVGGDAELLVFYAGARDLPVSFSHGEEDAKAHCKE